MLTIDTQVICPFMAPVQQPQLMNDNGYYFPQPEWCQRSQYPVIIYEAGGIQSWMLTNPINFIGRNEKSSVVVENLHVSRCHAAIMTSKTGALYLVDLGSTHGTFIGKCQLMPFTPTLLPEGSLIKLGMVSDIVFSVKNGKS